LYNQKSITQIFLKLSKDLTRENSKSTIYSQKAKHSTFNPNSKQQPNQTNTATNDNNNQSQIPHHSSTGYCITVTITINTLTF